MCCFPASKPDPPGQFLQSIKLEVPQGAWVPKVGGLKGVVATHPTMLETPIHSLTGNDQAYVVLLFNQLPVIEPGLMKKEQPYTSREL